MFKKSMAFVVGLAGLVILFLIWPQPERTTEIVPVTAAAPPRKTESPVAVDIRDRLKGGLESFSLEGVRFPMSVEQFRKEKPAAILYRLKEELGQECLAIPLPPPATLATFDFVDGKLYEIELSYPKRQIEAVAKDIIALLGPAVQDSEDQYNWMTTGRIAELKMQSDGTLVFSVADPRLNLIYTQRWRRKQKAEDEARRREQEQRELAQREAEEYRRARGYGLGMTTSGYLFLKNGMSKLDVDAVLGCFGEEQSRAGSLRVYAWEKGFAQVVATFRNDKLVSKSQFGL